jgi:SAM-dependent methyltransferase
MPLGKRNLYVGGAGAGPVSANLEALPFPDATFEVIECDAGLEHVGHVEAAVRELNSVLCPGSLFHIVVPFCHPFHEYPRDFRRFTPDDLRALAPDVEVVAEGWRTGPPATLLVLTLEWFNLWLQSRIWRTVVHGIAGWLLFPLRYMDVSLFESQAAGRIGTTATSGSENLRSKACRGHYTKEKALKPRFQSSRNWLGRSFR